MSETTVAEAVEHTVGDKIEAQRQYCIDTGYPHFAPSDGKCYKCNRQIYELVSYESASTALVTGCPHCHRSFVS